MNMQKRKCSGHFLFFPYKSINFFSILADILSGTHFDMEILSLRKLQVGEGASYQFHPPQNLGKPRQTCILRAGIRIIMAKA